MANRNRFLGLLLIGTLYQGHGPVQRLFLARAAAPAHQRGVGGMELSLAGRAGGIAGCLAACASLVVPLPIKLLALDGRRDEEIYVFR